jgi:predicted DNA-binding transcriptional regulator AlpA
MASSGHRRLDGQTPARQRAVFEEANKPALAQQKSLQLPGEARCVSTQAAHFAQAQFWHESPGGGVSAHVVPAFFRLRDVLRITSLSRPTLYRRIASHRFPAPVHLGGRASGWTFASIQNWIADPEGYRAPNSDVEPTVRRRGRPRKYASV